MTENRFETNRNFSIQLSGYYAFVNISSNNFTDNFAPFLTGILELKGMEKFLIMERNRFFNNWVYCKFLQFNSFFFRVLGWFA